jgi:hypothetical protein
MNKKEKGKPKVMWSYRIEPELMELLKLKRKEKGKAFPGWIREKLKENLK